MSKRLKNDLDRGCAIIISPQSTTHATSIPESQLRRKKTFNDEAILELLEGGMSMGKTAKELGVSLSIVQRAKKIAA